jgi:hypothetical protein
MLARVKKKPDDQTPVTNPSFEDSKRAIADARATWEAVTAEAAALRALRSLNASSGDEDPSRTKVVRALVAKHFGANPPASWRLPELILEADERVTLAQPAWLAAEDEWRKACSRETSRVAVTLQPRQRAAVRKIAAAVEALSLAMAEERAVHVELARTAPNPTSAYLPACSPRLSGVEQYGGELFAWRARVLEIGILDQ